MNFLSIIKMIIARAPKVLFSGFVFTVFAARLSADPCADALEGSGMETTIAAVEASRENEDTPLEYSLTTDDPESSTMEVPAEAPACAETYSSPGTDVQRNGSSAGSINAAAREAAAVETGNSSAADGSRTSLSANTDSHNDSTAASDTGSSSVNADAGTPDSNTGSGSVYTAAKTTDGSNTTTAGEADNSSANTANGNNGNNTAAVSEPDNSSANAAANAASSNEAAAADSAGDNKTCHHTTSIYADDDTTLLRVEYLDENGKVLEYSKVTDYDKDTNSYTETVYMYDWDEEKEYVTRTNTYVDGELVSSENP